MGKVSIQENTEAHDFPCVAFNNATRVSVCYWKVAVTVRSALSVVIVH